MHMVHIFVFCSFFLIFSYLIYPLTKHLIKILYVVLFFFLQQTFVFIRKPHLVRASLSHHRDWVESHSFHLIFYLLLIGDGGQWVWCQAVSEVPHPGPLTEFTWLATCPMAPWGGGEGEGVGVTTGPLGSGCCLRQSSLYSFRWNQRGFHSLPGLVLCFGWEQGKIQENTAKG